MVSGVWTSGAGPLLSALFGALGLVCGLMAVTGIGEGIGKGGGGDSVAGLSEAELQAMIDKEARVIVLPHDARQVSLSLRS